jgi:hypothetical protein
VPPPTPPAERLTPTTNKITWAGVQNFFLGSTVVIVAPMIVLAANNFDDEVNAELDRMYQTSKTQSQQKDSPAAVQVNVNQAQQQDQVQQQVQKQPTTYIEASPLTESRADKIRKARQEVEVQTEQRIVEKLEMSRIEDERRRSEILFGDKFNQLSNQGAQQVQVVQQQQAVPVVVASPVVQEIAAPVVVHQEEDTLDKEEVRAEISAALSEMNEQNKKQDDKTYFSGLLGMADYPDAKNLKGEYAAGVAFGKVYDGKLAFEGSFIYASYQVEQVCPYSYYGYGYGAASCGGYYMGQYFPTITQMDQYQVGMTAKYMFLKGFAFRPLIGGTVAYSYRSFTDTQFARYNSDATSQALDLGLVAGMDIELSDSFSIGLDYRYFMNLTNRNSGQFQQSYLNQNEPGRKPVETLNYQTLSIVGRTSF